MKTILILFSLALGCLTTALAQPKKVLMVLSAANSLSLNGGKTYQTGVFLGEFYQTYQALTTAGYGIELATPSGRVPSIDPESSKEKYWKNEGSLLAQAQRFVTTNPQFLHPTPLSQVVGHEADYIGLVIPGGQGLMTDLYHDAQVARLLETFGRQQKAVGLICHAPSLLLTIPVAQNPFIGYRVNSVTPTEEWFVEHMVMKGRPHQRKIARQLRQLGLVYCHGRPGKPFAERDRQLITSQNPYSGRAFNQLYLTALGEQQYKVTLKGR